MGDLGLIAISGETSSPASGPNPALSESTRYSRIVSLSSLFGQLSALHPRYNPRYNGGVVFRIRQFDRSDFDTLWRIDQACFDPQLAYSQREMAFYMRRPGAFTLVAEEGSDVAGQNDARQSEIQQDKIQQNKAHGNGGTGAAIPSRPILGFVVAESGRRNGHIITIDVIAAARREGVGSALLRAAEEQLLRAGASTVALETPLNNTGAIHFYKKHGYFVEKTVAGYYSNQMDALVMTKELTESPVG